MGSCLSVDGGNYVPYSPLSPSGVMKKRSNSRRRQGMQSNSFDNKEDELRRIPGRIFSNGASDVASIFTQQGKKGTNQDAMIVWENFGSRTDTVFCGVFDGHGPFGHMVARRVRDSLPLKLSAHWEVNIHSNKGLKENSSTAAGSMNSEETSSISVDEEWMVTADLEEIEKHTEIFLTLKDSFLKAFKVMDKELRVHRKIDCFCSGTTAVTLIKQGRDLVIGNIGDSRAILGTRDEDNSLIAIQLTVDLKPNLQREAERIRKCRGRVFALQDEPEVARVWLPNYDSPGLAMARAFGDFCLKDFGLISEPDISYRRLTEKDEFIVLATDGIWDVLSNKEVVDIVASAPSRSSAARTLVESAVRAWKFKYPTSKVDDCAVVCLFLDCSPKNSSSVKPKKEQVSPRGLAMGSIKQDPTSPVMLKELSATARDCPEILPEEDEGSEQVCDVPKGEEEWSALEGVARVNTLLTLPRFIPGGDQNRSAVQKSAREG
eukprot:TRINITY_DN422_c1_g1_i1.p1 TRINITY_DN422_c1_g1~~TRINITY_DN422_c1_g1_i1.p1  ORF type:complete len:490 (+),score=112.52 TRINITY_DN422_c1_g1_i1:830-2299(+)